MKIKAAVSLLIIFVLAGLAWQFRGPLAAAKDKAAATIQQRMARAEEKAEVKKLVACIDKNPNMTVIVAGFAPELAAPAPQGRRLLITVSYTIDTSLPAGVKREGFGEGHRTVFLCALDLKSQWKTIALYYVDFTPTYVLDDTQDHIVATLAMSIVTDRSFVEQAIAENDIFTFLMNAVGYEGEVPPAKVILMDLSNLGIGVPGKAANGDVPLAIKRFWGLVKKK